MRVSKQGTFLVILTTAGFFMTYIYIYHTRVVYDYQIRARLTDDNQKLPPIESERVKEQTNLSLDTGTGTNNENPNETPLSKLHLDTKRTQELKRENLKPDLPTPLPKTGLANSSLIGSFNESLSFSMNWPDKCLPDNGKNLDVLIVVISAVYKREARIAIRQTWGGHALKRGAQLIFLTGQTTEREEADAIIKENEQFRDIVQQNLDDVYYNLTLKAVGMVKWAYEYCKNVKFVFKVDDDMFINSELLLAFAKANLHLKKTIIGSLWPGGEPIRELGKWYVPMSLYPYPYYPTYVSGGAYLITGDSVPLLYETSLQVPTFLFEDVLLAGMVAEKAGVKRKHANQISANHFEIEETCKFRDFISVHNYRPKIMIYVWHRLNRRDIKCSTASNEKMNNADSPKK